MMKGRLKMIRTNAEQIDYVKVCIGHELARLAFATTSDEKYTCNENIDYLQGILEHLERRT